MKWPYSANPNDSKYYPHDEDFKIVPDEAFDLQGEIKDGSMYERTFVLLKPDAFERGLVGEILDTLERRGMRLIAAKKFTMNKYQCQEHYSHHTHKDFWPELLHFMTTGPSLALIYEGVNACQAVRQLIGQKHPAQSPPGSIRGRYAMEFPRNLVHGSDNSDEARKEIELFFAPMEIFDETYKKNMHIFVAQKKVLAAAAKKAKIEEGISVGDVVEYPQQLRVDDYLAYGVHKYVYRITGVEQMDPETSKVSMLIFFHNAQKQYNKLYTDLSWATQGGDWILIKRDGKIAVGYEYLNKIGKPMNSKGLPKFSKQTKELYNPSYKWWEYAKTAGYKKATGPF